MSPGKRRDQRQGAVRAPAWWVVLLAVSAAAAFCTGCGGGDSTTIIQTVEPAEVPSESSQAAPESEEASPADATSPAQATRSQFYSPSHNIACDLGPEGAICDTRERDWTPSVPRPPSCNFDWGPRVGVEEFGPGEFVCVSDSLHGGSYRVLPYGSAIKRGGITCTSEEAGVTCVNEGGGGFFVSQQTVRLL